jgi:hypothetical protein
VPAAEIPGFAQLGPDSRPRRRRHRGERTLVMEMMHQLGVAKVRQ